MIVINDVWHKAFKPIAPIGLNDFCQTSSYILNQKMTE